MRRKPTAKTALDRACGSSSLVSGDVGSYALSGTMDLRRTHAGGLASELREPSPSRQELLDLLERYLICPITLELMSDPVVAPDGETYERAAITCWLHDPAPGFPDGHCTSPLTKARLTSKTLLPNKRIKRLGAEWSALRGHPPSLPQDFNFAHLLGNPLNFRVSSWSYGHPSRG